MATPKIQVAPELVAEGKQLYENTMTPIADIAALMGIKRRTLENRIAEWSWKRRRQPSGAVDLFHAVRGAAIATMTQPVPAAEARDTPQARLTLALRMQAAVERELGAIERVLDTINPSDGGEAERNTRTLAGIGRTLRDIHAILQPTPQTPLDDDADDDPIPRDIDAFRDELARRIKGLVDAERAREGEGADGAGDAGH
jgi:hypothetical protein